MTCLDGFEDWHSLCLMNGYDVYLLASLYPLGHRL
jgi:hypothetical protein